MPFPFPATIDPLPSATIRPGLIVISTMALLSLIATSCAATFIIYRVSNGKQYQKTPLRYNQSLILILNLLLADFQQALSFCFSLHWLYKNAIIAPTGVCSAQGWLVQIGDVSSGMFSLCIALQTFYIIVLQRRFPYKRFVLGVCAVWVFCVTLSIVSPIIHHGEGEELYVATGAWCWISSRYRDERLFVHYLWIFTCEFGTLILYAIIFTFLRRNAKKNAASGVHTRTMYRVARLMLVYPVTYTCMTLPLAAYRMASQSGKTLSDSILVFAGACMASCGWLDVILYLVTRRTILSLQSTSFTSSGRDTGAIQMGTGRQLYGNQTVVERGSLDRAVRGESMASSQEGFVKMEQVVQVTIEDAVQDPHSRIGTSEDGSVNPQKPTNATSYW
ncbi:G protein-coupled glucose receptor regulating Gpa2-domain-containing protein [Sphaerosporella brunnea]|uniref:G protein-coupled glucose receptor regulating Gpa2-domain-containing protein n=1 Tax=Sphaerosporella brunnea TaxID=1250544 RepID=A0A5J5EUC6_9PEZI|nr:G protein-coupled glucose receptor regulating Gpa2-domain-containing protein [Sphaerosporella brunnea]